MAAARNAARARQRLIEDIERLCADAGISLAALARAAGVPYEYLWRIMRGRARGTLETFAKVAIPLGADLSTRLYPTTGPTIRDRHQATILEHLLGIRAPRFRPWTEVGVVRPARGWIDVVFDDPRAALVIATEIESDLRRIEQIVRRSREKADSLPSWPGWHDLRHDAPTQITQLVVVRRTRSNRHVAAAFAQQLTVAFPAHPEDAIRSLTGSAAWPGSALVWAQVDGAAVRLLPTR